MSFERSRLAWPTEQPACRIVVVAQGKRHADHGWYEAALGNVDLRHERVEAAVGVVSKAPAVVGKSLESVSPVT